MKIDRTMAYDIPPDEAVAMSCSQAFQERKCADAGALSWSVRVSAEPDGDTLISNRRKVPTVGFPSLLRKMLPEGITLTETIRWNGQARPDGARTASLNIDFHGAPAKMEGSIEVARTPAGGSLVHIVADFKAAMPLIGGKIEKAASPIIIGVIDAEQETGRAWVADAA